MSFGTVKRQRTSRVAMVTGLAVSSPQAANTHQAAECDTWCGCGLQPSRVAGWFPSCAYARATERAKQPLHRFLVEFKRAMKIKITSIFHPPAREGMPN